MFEKNGGGGGKEVVRKDGIKKKLAGKGLISKEIAMILDERVAHGRLMYYDNVQMIPRKFVIYS